MTNAPHSLTPSSLTGAVSSKRNHQTSVAMTPSNDNHRPRLSASFRQVNIPPVEPRQEEPSTRH